MSRYGNKDGKDNLITSRRKKRAQELRKGQSTVLPGEEGRNRSNYVMEEGTNPDAGSSKYKYAVNPTIFPNKDGSWTDMGGQGLKAYDEAKSRGEVFGFKSERRAKKFAAGSWKKGEDRRDAMRDYKISNIDENKRLNRIVDRRYKRYDRQSEKAKGNLEKESKLQKKKGYTYESGVKPDETGHYPSIGEGGRVLKAKRHPSMIKTKKVERLLGNKIIKKDGERYSVPKSKKKR